MTHSNPRLPPSRLMYVPEPALRFRHDQLLDDPKDGLLLFGPPKQKSGFTYGVIGTKEGIRQFGDWAKRIQNAIPAASNVTSSVTFPGFEAAFRMPWPNAPRVVREVDAAKLNGAIRISDPHQRVWQAVDIYATEIIRWHAEEDAKADVWFVVVPEDLWKFCRPKSTVPKSEVVQPDIHLSHGKALQTLQARDLFDDYNLAAEKHLYENHFHNQLKAKLLETEAVTQLIRQSTIAPYEHLNVAGKPARQLQDDATVAWNLATAIYYKAGEMPWTLADIRDGVCYIGLVFKKTNNPGDAAEACCGAQMFLQTGEGIVFKGAIGSWASGKPGEFHLPREQAAQIVRDCVKAYRLWHDGQPPQELFIHGRTVFGPDEIAGFREAAPAGTKVSGIQIRRPNDLKLFRDGRRAMLRGLALPVSNRSAFLWSSGYVPHLRTYPGREVPTPLKVKIVFGDAPLDTVLSDILALTKVNFNACIYSDGLPVTLRFADDIGEILTAGPPVPKKPLPFRFYI
ncbi:hypothetical protein [Bosea sp. 117]|uniref:argonaute/piwi family protein n=1 Tax=Bosea sp. 117 TaxID=1125973 RepID=UPI000A99C559|nr:hypothetical protein [Bosea sp. 117]